MTLSPDSGFKELEHTADYSIMVWAVSIEELFHQAALGMYTFLKPEFDRNSEIKEVEFTLQAIDEESLLVAFLSELILYLEEQYLVFTDFSLMFSRRELSVKLTGREYKSLKDQIKAVTYSEMEISRSEQGFHTKIVFDI